MGVNESKEQNIQNEDQIIGNYTILKKLNDFRYGDVKLVKNNKNEELYILRTILVNTKESYEKEINIISQRKAHEHPNIIRVIGYSAQEKEDFCSHFYKISIFIEFHERDLDIELNDRIKNRNPYTDPEFLYMIKSLVSGLYLFQSQNLSHGDVRPINIFVANDGTYKISDPILSSQKPNSLAQTLMGNTQCYLSPKLLVALLNQDFTAKVNPVKADVYSLGITLLSCATLSRAEEFYDYKKAVIDFLLIAEKLKKLQKIYSIFVYELISEMLKVDEEERPDFIKLKEISVSVTEPFKKKEILIMDTKLKVMNTPKRVRTSPEKISKPKLNYASPLNVYSNADFNISTYSYSERVKPVIAQKVKSQIKNININSYSPARLITNSEPPIDRYFDIPKSQFYSTIIKNYSNENLPKNLDFSISLPYSKEYHISSDKKANAEILYSVNKQNKEETKEMDDPEIYETFGNESNYSPDCHNNNNFLRINNLTSKNIDSFSSNPKSSFLESPIKQNDLIIAQSSQSHEYKPLQNEKIIYHKLETLKIIPPNELALPKSSLKLNKYSPNYELHMSPSTSQPQLCIISQPHIQPTSQSLIKSSDLTPLSNTPFYEYLPLEKSFISISQGQVSKENLSAQILKLIPVKPATNPLEDYHKRVKEALERSQGTMLLISQGHHAETDTKQSPLILSKESVEYDHQGNSQVDNLYSNPDIKTSKLAKNPNSQRNSNISKPVNEFNFRFDDETIGNLAQTLLSFYEKEYINAKNKLNEDYQYA